MEKLLVCFAVLAVLACKPNWTDDSAHRCGETFCFRAGASIVEKESPVEDYNLYKVNFRGQSFQIYEGNSPSPAVLNGRMIEKSGRKISTGMVNNKLVVRVSWIARSWPQFLQFSSHSLGSSQKDLLDLADQVEINGANVSKEK